MSYPTLEEIKTASRFDICRWYRFLPSPTNEVQVAVINAIMNKFIKYGGFTPEISKAVGWE